MKKKVLIVTIIIVVIAVPIAIGISARPSGFEAPGYLLLALFGGIFISMMGFFQFEGLFIVKGLIFVVLAGISYWLAKKYQAKHHESKSIALTIFYAIVIQDILGWLIYALSMITRLVLTNYNII